MTVIEPWQRLSLFSPAGGPTDGKELLLRQPSAVWTGKNDSLAPNSILIFGGNNLDIKQSAKAWSFDLDSREWTLLAPAGTAEPSGRSAHGAVWTGRRMLAFGGTCGASCSWITSMSCSR